MQNKNIAYLRVSTVEQDLEKNKADILTFANNKDFGKVKFVEEKVSGTKNWKHRKPNSHNQFWKSSPMFRLKLSRLLKR